MELGTRCLTSAPGSRDTCSRSFTPAVNPSSCAASHSSAEESCAESRSGSATVLWGAECTVSPAEDGDGVGEELALFSPAGTKTHHMRGTEERTF